MVSGGNESKKSSQDLCGRNDGNVKVIFPRKDLLSYPTDTNPVTVKAGDYVLVKGEFYNIGVHKKPAFAPTPFSLPPDESNMLYMGISAFTANSAGFVYKNAGALTLRITDDMFFCIRNVYNTDMDAGCMAERLKTELLEKERVVDVVAGPDAYRDLLRLLALAHGGQRTSNVLLSLEEAYADVMPIHHSGHSAF
ncbi:hypothetical protein P4O66_003726, partial [Electrophorus voltai]